MSSLNSIWVGFQLFITLEFISIFFNLFLDNTTNFNKEEDDEKDEKDEKSDLKIKIDADEHNLNVDYSLYCKFWQIQDYFRNPVQCYQKVPWKTFSSYASDVLSTFQSFKLDPNSGPDQKKFTPCINLLLQVEVRV